MPRPEQRMITLTIDGREVEAPENSMLADGAKCGDVEIPVFCYEPKLGNPVGACRMCLVEIEGIPKLQTACSTPVKDGMVVHTESDRVKDAQNAVVEFLLVNHPLDCPVCDKGGECPLQDITFGWGRGVSRFIEPKRHFRKPLELSPLIAIDRERCILCYRCVRFSQEVAEDYQLVLLERGSNSFVGTFDGHPYVAPFSGNITELCPVGALTSISYRFRARPWDIEQSGSICTLCPSQCNVSFTVRDDKVLRVLARDNHEVDDGWLCDKGRYAFESIEVDERLTTPMAREGGQLRPVSWERALDEAARAISKARGKAAALAGGSTTNEEGYLLQRLLRDGLGSNDLDCRRDGSVALDLQRALAAPTLQATVPDVEFAHAVLVLDCEPVDDMASLDLRIRKGVRRNGVKLAVATSRPSTLDPNAALSLRIAPGGGEALLAALSAALGGAGDLVASARAAGVGVDEVQTLATLLRDAGRSDGEPAGNDDAPPADVVVIWSERLTSGERADDAARGLLEIASRLRLAEIADAGLLEIPASANGRGLREAGVLPNAAPGYGEPGVSGRDARGIAQALAEGELTTLLLLDADPLRDYPDRASWEHALDRATTVIAFESQLTETVREHANVVFPADAYAEKEGTVVHPDGRVQRLRQAVGRPRDVRAGWSVLGEIAARAGIELAALTASMVSSELFAAVPFYAGLTLEELGGHGLRWPEREQASGLPAGTSGPFELAAPPEPSPSAAAALRIGRYRPIWASKEVEISPQLKFLTVHQRVELAPDDARSLGVSDGDTVEVAANGHRVRATVLLRAGVPTGTAFLAEGTREDGANALGDETLVTIHALAEATA